MDFPLVGKSISSEYEFGMVEYLLEFPLVGKKYNSVTKSGQINLDCVHTLK